MFKKIGLFLIPILLSAQMVYAVDTKVSALPTATPISTDEIYLVDDPGGTPSSKKSTFASAFDAIISINSIDDTHIDFGTGANQVSAVDIPILDSGANYTGTEIETALIEIADGTTLDSKYVEVIGDTMTGQLFIDGSSDQIQALIQGNATQTSDLITAETSTGTDVLNLTNAGALTIAGSLVTGGTGQSTITEGLIVNNGATGASTSDFQVKGDTIDNTFYVDTSADKVGILTATPLVPLHVLGNIRLERTDTSTATFRILNTANSWQFQIPSSGNWEFRDNTGGFTPITIEAAAGNQRFNIRTAETVINDIGGDKDFRVEGDTEGNLLFIDASTERVGISTASPSTTFEVSGTISYEPSTTQNITAAGGITVTNGVMRVQGNAAPITITATPSIVDGQDGEMVLLQGDNDTNTVTIQDEAQLASSGFSCDSNANVTLGKGDMVWIQFDVGDDKWYCVSPLSNN